MFERRGNGVAEGSGRPDVTQGTRAEAEAQQGAPTEPSDRRSADPEFEIPRKARMCAMAFAALCGVIALVSQGAIFRGEKLGLIWPPEPRAWADWVLQLHWVVAFLVLSPFLIVTIVLLDLHALRPNRRRYFLVASEPSTAGIPEAHAQEDRELWEKRRRAVKASWEYEKDRILRLQCRMVLQALIFADLATFALMCAALAASAWQTADGTPRGLACSAAAAAAAAFLFNLGRIMLRISGGDVTARAFSWAIRSVALVVIADLGLCVLLQAEVTDATHAMLLGLFVGATGDHAIEFLLDKGAKVFGTGSGEAPKASPLLDIEGMTKVHVDRLEEEGIVSIHDLAFAPTARLFLSTAYSLQQICNWQDRALLLVYVGRKGADALAQQMNIRGAIDLRAFAHDLLFGGGCADKTHLRDALRKALAIEDGGLDAVLESMAHDEVAMRIRYYWGAVIAPERCLSQLDPPARAPSQQAPAVASPSAAIVAASQIVVPAAPLAMLRPAAQAAAPGPADAIAPIPNGKPPVSPPEPAPSATESAG
jgi:hypothetical protein